MGNIFEIIFYGILAYVFYWVARGFTAGAAHAEVLHDLYSLF